MAPPATLHLSDRQRLDWLQLVRCENVGPATFRSLVNHYGSAARALEALPQLARRAGSAPRRMCTRADAERELEQTLASGGQLVALGETGYPALLAHIDAPPPLLSVLGSPFVLQRQSVAIVGARNASAAGRRMAEILATGLGQHGLAVISGLARGIDAAAHRAALASGTAAVVAGGLDRLYPNENIPLAKDIAASGGCIVTEMPLGHEARARDFPRRNRLISGISTATVIVEAALRSGSLHTARFAADQGRDVMAVPGSPLDPRAEGSNQLIKQGAAMITCVEDVLEALNLRRLPPAVQHDLFREDAAPAPVQDVPETARQRITGLLGPVPSSPDELARLSGDPVRDVLTVLLELDLAGRLERHASGSVSLTGAGFRG